MSQAAPAPENVLVVDDDDAVRRTVRRTLEHAGYHVTEASNVPDAVAALDSALDYIVLDIVLGDRTGLEVAQAAKHLPRPPRMVAITGDASRAMCFSLHAAGIEVLLEKPGPWDLPKVLRDLPPPSAALRQVASNLLGRMHLLPALSEFRWSMLGEALDRCGGDRSLAAERLGITRQALHKATRRPRDEG